MNPFGAAVVVLFVCGAAWAAWQGNWVQFQIYLASAWLNIVFLKM